jgi:hypothetical protein
LFDLEACPSALLARPIEPTYEPDSVDRRRHRDPEEELQRLVTMFMTARRVVVLLLVHA